MKWWPLCLSSGCEGNAKERWARSYQGGCTTCTSSYASTLETCTPHFVAIGTLAHTIYYVLYIIYTWILYIYKYVQEHRIWREENVILRYIPFVVYLVKFSEKFSIRNFHRMIKENTRHHFLFHSPSIDLAAAHKCGVTSSFNSDSVFWYNW